MKEIDLKNGKKRRKSCLARPRAVELSKWAEDHCLPTTSVLYIYSDEKTARENSKRSKMIRLFTNNWTLGIMFGLGLNIAGADGEWIPWANFIGVLMIGYVVLIANYLRPAP